MNLVWPSLEYLPHYIAALERGWSPENARGAVPPMVVPWKRRRGYATRALGLMLQAARTEGLRHVEITTRPDNVGSRRVIETNGGVFVEEFVKVAALGGGREVRYRVSLAESG